jgi:hypothetical protein
MKKLLFFISLILLTSHAFSQNIVTKNFDDIKRIIQPDIIQLPDSVITFPLIGLTNIRVIPGSQLSGFYVEIELWIIDNDGKIIYDNVIATDKNTGQYPVDVEYCRYMKLQCNYLLHQRHVASYHP